MSRWSETALAMTFLTLGFFFLAGIGDLSFEFLAVCAGVVAVLSAPRAKEFRVGIVRLLAFRAGIPLQASFTKDHDWREAARGFGRRDVHRFKLR